MINKAVHNTLKSAGIFVMNGAHVLVDGQFGSTGKGLIAGALAEYDKDNQWVDEVTTNAGPNSGHTFVDGYDEIMTQQLPVFSCVSKKMGRKDLTTSLNAGAVLDPNQVNMESEKYGVQFRAHVNSALILPEVNEQFSSEGMDAIASTGKGVGQAMASKVLRMPTTTGTADPSVGTEGWPLYAHPTENIYRPIPTTFIETAQGYSLGCNSGFYPYTTSRECTVAQALADAQIPPTHLQTVVMSVRTFPIRVGNTNGGTSGPCYPDQREISWEDVGVEPELTTVTKRVRRVFTWSWLQYSEALMANQPDVVFLNFCNYTSFDELEEHVQHMQREHRILRTSGYIRNIPKLLLGFGPETKDIRTVAQALGQ